MVTEFFSPLKDLASML